MSPGVAMAVGIEFEVFLLSSSRYFAGPDSPDNFDMRGPFAFHAV